MAVGHFGVQVSGPRCLAHWLYLLGHLDRTDRWSVLSLTPVLFLLWQVKMSAVKKVLHCSWFESFETFAACHSPSLSLISCHLSTIHSNKMPKKDLKEKIILVILYTDVGCKKGRSLKTGKLLFPSIHFLPTQVTNEGVGVYPNMHQVKYRETPCRGHQSSSG